MSVVHDKMKRSEDDAESQKWYLKLPDGNVYGPVDVEELADWASQLRIAPGNEVSTDQKNWQPAEDIKELKMEWTAKLPDGNMYGPFNMLAVPHLYKNGTLPANANLENKDTGKVVQVHELLKESGVAIEEDAEVVSPAVTLKEKKDSKWEVLYKEEKALRRKLEAKHEKEIGGLVVDFQDAKTEITKIKKESTKRITEQSKSDKDKIKGAEQKESDLQTEFTKLKEQHAKDLALLEESQARTKEMDSVKASLNKAESSSAEEKTKSEASSDELKQTKTRLKESENKIKELDQLQSQLGQVENEKLSLQEDLNKVKEIRSAEQKALAEAEAGVKKAESELSTLSDSSGSEKARSAEELRGKDSELRRLSDELAKAESRCKEVEKVDAELRKKLEALETDAEENASDMSFKLENMTKELETQKTLYSKIEQSGADKGEEIQKEIETAYKVRDDVESAGRKLKAELEQSRKSAEKAKTNFEEQIGILKTEMEKSKASAERSEEEKSAVTEKLLSTRRDLNARIEDLFAKLKGVESESRSLTQELSSEVVGRTEDSNKIAALEEALEDNKKKCSELDEAAGSREAELKEQLSLSKDNVAETRTRIEASEKQLADSEGAHAAAMKDVTANAEKQIAELENMHASAEKEVRANAEKQIADLEKTVQRQTEEYNEMEEGSGGRIEDLHKKISQMEDESTEYKSRIGLLEEDLAARAEIVKTAEKNAREAGEKLVGDLEDASGRLETVNLSHGKDMAKLEDELAVQVKRFAYLEEESRKREEQLLEQVSSKGDQAKEYKKRLAILEKELDETGGKLFGLEKSAAKDISEAKEDGIKDLDNAVSMSRVAEEKLEAETQAHKEKQRELENTIASLRSETKVLTEDLRKYKDESVSNDSIVKEGLERAKTESADLRKELEELRTSYGEAKKTAEAMKARCEDLSSELKTEKDAEGVLSQEVQKAEETLDSEKKRFVQQKDRHDKDEGAMAEQESKLRDMLAKDREQMAAIREEAGALRAELKSLKEDHNSLLESQEKQRSESSGLSAEKGQLTAEKEQLLIEKTELGDGMKKLNKSLEKSDQGKEHINSELSKKAAELEKTQNALSEKEKMYDESEKQSKEAEKEYKTQVKHLKGVSKMSAEVVERLNAQIIDYRGKYDSYEAKTKKLLAEVEEKKTEMSELRHSYEPLLKRSQQSEKDLLKKVARLETAKARLSRPIEPLSDRIGDVVERVRLGLSSTEGFFKKYPYIMRNAFVALGLLLCTIVVFKMGWTEKRGEELTSGMRVVEVANREEPLVLTRAQIDIEKKVVAIENSLLAVYLEMSTVPDEPEAKQIAAVIDDSDVIVAAVPEIEEVIEEIEEEPFETPVEKPKVFAEELDLDLEPSEPVAVAKKPSAPEDTKWPVINIAGTRVEYTGKMCRILFEEGIFTHMTVIPSDMVKVLGEVATQVKGSTGAFKMIVEGHCDSVPLSGKSSVKSNYVLGMARAKTVAKLLEQRFGIPAKFMIPTSSGEKDPPYSNDDPVERKKNRTVILEIIPNR